MKKLILFYNYCIYRLKAVNEHGVHSPFVFDLLMNVVYNRTEYYSYKSIEGIREELLNSKKLIKFQQGKSEAQKSVSKLTEQYERPAKYGQLLFRLVNHFQPQQIIELGSITGVSTSYMAAANSKIKILIIPNDPYTVEIAKENFRKLKLKNIEMISGDINSLLPEILSKPEPLDFVFINGNNKDYSILKCFNQCLEKANESSVFVLCDMYKTPEMKDAWDQIKNNNRVTVTLDLFFIGIVFFRKEQVKQHFVIKF
ncbi:MAG: methyltransferase domain-containing protein [Bacteroidota bacterium]